MNKLKKGVYKHYKGGRYRLLGISKIKGQDQEVVVFESLKDGQIGIRPIKEWSELVEVGKGIKEKRFKLLDDNKEENWEYRYKRALADYHNLVKQTAKEKQDFIKYCLNDILQEILPIYDHLKLSLQGLKTSESDNPWVTGVRHVLKQFKEVLTSHGVEEIKTVGEKFDHETMEAVGGKGEKVKQELMPGYKLNGRLIRPAKVIVE